MITHVYAMGVGAVLSALITWQLLSGHYLSQLQTERLAWQQSHSEALAKAAKETAKLQEKKDEADRLAQIRQSALARDVAAGRDALVRLSDAADSALRASQDSHKTCIKAADAFADVFGQCRGQLREMGEAADGHANDAKTLSDAWPKEEYERTKD